MIKKAVQASVCVGMFLFIFIIVVDFIFYPPINRAAGLIRLAINKNGYQQEINELPQDQSGPKLKAWKWGEHGGAPVQNSFWYLVYDDSDQITLPLSNRSEAWMAHAEKVAKEVGGFYALIHPEGFSTDVNSYMRNIYTQNLEGHFYLVTQYW